MPLKILHAADASGAAEDLAMQLRRWRNRSLTILLTSNGLEGAPGKNDIVREALAAANDGTLLVVRLDEAPAPVGTRDAPCVPWTPGASVAEVQSAVRPLAKKTKRGLSGGCLFAVIAVVALVAISIVSLNFIGSDVAMLDDLSPSTSERPAIGTLEAIQGRWALTTEGCEASYLDLSSTGTELRSANADTSETMSITSVDERSRTIAVVDATGSPLYYRVSQDTLTVEHIGGPSTLVRCRPRAEPPSVASAEITEIQEGIRNVEGHVAALEGSIRTVQDNVRSLTDRVTLIIWVLIALLIVNILVALGVRLPSHRRGSPTPVESASGPLVVASYARKDGEAVDQVIKQIERGGVAIWMDKADIGAGTTWSEEIVRAIRNSRGLILFCSEHAFESDHVLRELNLADSCRKPVYPVLLETVAVPDSFLYYLSTRQILDVKNDPDWQAKLAAALKPSVRQLDDAAT